VLVAILQAVFTGVLFGTITGLIPGIHTNLVASLLPLFVGSSFSSSWTGVFLISMGVTHTVTSILPNVYLGVCEGDDVVNVLPAHQLVIEGRGGDAVMANVFGGCVAACLGALYFGMVVFFVGEVYPLVEAYLPLLLLVVTAYLIGRGSSLQRSSIIVGLSAGLGYVVLTSPLNNAMFPLLSGLFGVPLLMASEGDNVGGGDRSQGVDTACCRSGMIGSVLGLVTSMLPGVGSGVAASFGTRFVPRLPETYLGMTGAVDTADFYLSLATLWAVEKARNGVVVVMDQMLGSFGFGVLVCSGVIAVGGAGLVTLTIQPHIPSLFDVVPYEYVSNGVVGVLGVLTAVMSGVRGFAVLIVASLLGLVAHWWGVPKISMMACIVVPVLVFLV